jgi:hypothetical protein
MMAATLQFRLTEGGTRTGTEAHIPECSSPASSLGGRMSRTSLNAISLNNLFDNISPSQAVAGVTEYRAIDIYNSGDAVAQSIELWVSADSTHASTSIELALVSAATQNNHTLSTYLEKLATESSVPASPACSFSAAPVGSKLSMADITNGHAARVWIKRICLTNANNLANDTATISIQYA